MKSRKKKSIEEIDDDFEIDDEDDDLDVDDAGPAISQAKKSKTILIIVTAIIVTIVVYYLFIKEEKVKKERLTEVKREESPRVAPGDSNPFSLEIPVEEEEQEIEILEKPEAPTLPELPSLPEGFILPNQIFEEEEKKEEEVSQKEDVIQKEDSSQQKSDSYSDVNNPVNLLDNVSEGVTDKLKTDPRYAPIVVFDNGSPGPGLGVGYKDNIINLNNDPIDSLEKSASNVKVTHIADRSHTIAQGKLLTAVIETAINTEVPGFVRGIISRDVYGESGKEVLIPRGSRLFGSYSTSVVQGQARVEVGWTRLIRPDGVDLSISFNASDQFGRSGVPGDIDNKYGSIIASSLLTSVFAVGGAILAEKLLDDNSSTTTVDPSNGTSTTTGSAANQVVYDVSKTIVDTVKQVMDNRININPVIRVPQGTRITVIVNADIVVPSLRKY